jgi:hypothetical protein
VKERVSHRKISLTELYALEGNGLTILGMTDDNAWCLLLRQNLLSILFHSGLPTIPHIRWRMQ